MAIVLNFNEGCDFLNSEGNPVTNPNNGAVMSLGCLAQIVMSVIGWALTFLGLVTIIVLLFGAIKYVTSSGDPKAIQGAQKTMTYAVIGALVVILSFLLIQAVTNALGLPNIITNFTIYQGP